MTDLGAAHHRKEYRNSFHRHRFRWTISSFEAVIDNLDTYLVSLNQAVKPMQMVKHSFVHNEQMGVHAIDQSPLKKGAKALRLYVYPEQETSKLHVITFGDKDQQSDDVKECCEYVTKLRKEQQRKNEGEGNHE